MLIGIVAHVRREHFVQKLLQQHHIDVVRFDDGLPSIIGCAANHIRVLKKLQQCAKPGDEWCVVIEDDARPVPDFRDQLDKALSESESPLVGLYLGTSHPYGVMHSVVEPAVEAAKSIDSNWIVADWFNATVGYAIRFSLVPSLLEYVTTHGGPIDSRINEWSHTAGLKTWYTSPSLVDHRIEPSIINGSGDPKMHILMPRRAWYFGSRDRWGKSATEMGSVKGWSPE